MSAAEMPNGSAGDHVAALKELLGPDVVVITGAARFVEELAKALVIFRKGGERAHKNGAVAWIEAHSKLGKDVLTALGVHPTAQWKVSKPGQYVHGAIAELGRRVAPELVRRLESSHSQIRSIRWHACAAVAMQLLVLQRKSEPCAAKIAGKQFKIEPEAVNNLRDEARRRRGSRKHEALQMGYQILSADLDEHFPGDPAGAYAALIELAAQESGN